MKIAVDGRGVYWYRGTGMGTYTGALWKILELYKKKRRPFIPLLVGSSGLLISPRSML